MLKNSSLIFGGITMSVLCSRDVDYFAFLISSRNLLSRFVSVWRTVVYRCSPHTLTMNTNLIPYPYTPLIWWDVRVQQQTDLKSKAQRLSAIDKKGAYWRVSASKGVIIANCTELNKYKDDQVIKDPLMANLKILSQISDLLDQTNINFFGYAK